MRIARVQDQRDTHRLESCARQLGPMLGGRRRQLRALDMAEVATASLEQQAFLDQLGAAIALQPLTVGANPGVNDKRLAIGSLQRIDDAPLQVEQIVANGLGVHRSFLIRKAAQRLIARYPMSRRYCTPSIWMPPRVIVAPGISSFIRLMQRSNVDFPQPEGPMKAVTLWAGISSSMFFSASEEP